MRRSASAGRCGRPRRPRCTLAPMPSGARRRTHVRDRRAPSAHRRVPRGRHRDQRLLRATACEVTEIGAVLVGGGELHERWETLLAVRAPLGRGIQRFTGISQAMVDEAPPAEAMLPELAELMEGRVLVAHSAAFDVRVLRQAFAREGRRAGPSRPMLCTVALARRLAPLARQRKLGPLAEFLGIEVGRHPPGAGRRGDLRARLLRAAAPPDSPTRRRSRRRASCSARPVRGSRAPGRHRRRAAPAGGAPAGAGHLAPAARARRLHLPQRGGPAAVRGEVRRRAGAGAGALRGELTGLRLGAAGRDRRVRDDGLRARGAAARAPPRRGARAAGQHAAASRSRAGSGCAAGWTSPSRSSRSPPSPRRGAR